MSYLLTLNIGVTGWKQKSKDYLWFKNSVNHKILTVNVEIKKK